MLWFGIVKPCSFPAEGRARQPLQTFLNEATHREEAYFFSGNIAGTILAILAPLNQQALSSLPALATFFDLSPATTTRKWLRGGFVGRRARGSMGEALACCKPGQNSHCWTRIEFCQFSGLGRTMSFVCPRLLFLSGAAGVVAALLVVLRVSGVLPIRHDRWGGVLLSFRTRESVTQLDRQGSPHDELGGGPCPWLACLRRVALRTGASVPCKLKWAML